jgi:hypothetical protein
MHHSDIALCAKVESPNKINPDSMTTFDPRTYGPAIASLLERAPINDLGPGSARQEVRAALSALSPETMVVPEALADRDMAAAAVAGLWLRFDFLDESHRISQEIETPSGSYWHGIMHRRELDYDNAKYWFRRVGEHPVFPDLQLAASPTAEAGVPSQADYLRTATAWDPFRFVDLCRAAAGSPALGTLCKTIQKAEWELLFDHCYRRAIGQ